MSWAAEYLAALKNRDRHEQANKELIDAYTRLAENRVTKSQPAESTDKDTATSTTQAGPTDVVVQQLRADLVIAQKDREDLRKRISALDAELAVLSSDTTVKTKRINELSHDRMVLSSRLKDRDEELRGKAKLLDNVHDEMVALTLQLNISEERNGKLAKENEDLVKRWVDRMQVEADAMNDASQFH